MWIYVATSIAARQSFTQMIVHVALALTLKLHYSPSFPLFSYLLLITVLLKKKTPINPSHILQLIKKLFSLVNNQEKFSVLSPATWTRVLVHLETADIVSPAAVTFV